MKQRAESPEGILHKVSAGIEDKAKGEKKSGWDLQQNNDIRRGMSVALLPAHKYGAISRRVPVQQGVSEN